MRKNILKALLLSSVLLSLMLLLSSYLQEPQSTATSDDHSIKDTPFVQETHDAFLVGSDTKTNEVRSISVDEKENVWVATATGIFRKSFHSRSFLQVMQPENQGPSYSVKADREGSVWIGTWNGVYRFQNERLEKLEGVEPPISVIALSPKGVCALGPKGIWQLSDRKFKKLPLKIARTPRDAVIDRKGDLLVATDVGLYRCTDSTATLFQKEEELLSASLKSLAIRPKGEVWAGGLGGVTIRLNDRKTTSLTTEEGLSSAHVNTVREAPDGTMWIGTEVGIVRYRTNKSTSLLFSKRWLVNDQVLDIAFDSNGNAWVATAEGVSCIRQSKMTLAEKAATFYQNLMRRHIRPPWIASWIRLTTPGDTTKFEIADDDNDGQYTGMYLAMESMRFAATRDADAREKARKAFGFLYFLQEVTGTDAFFARTIVPASMTGYNDGNRSFSPRETADELVREPRFKPVEVRWHPSKDGKWLWKGDTSSDELCGHMFGYFFYYKYAADETAKNEVARHVIKIVDGLMANNYQLIDVDGSHTRWGVWSPDKLNNDPDWLPDRGLNSLELLSFLQLAYHVSGVEKYHTEYLRLIREEHYLENAQSILHHNPAFRTYIDPELTLLIFPSLILNEKDPQLRKSYLELLESWYRLFRDDKSPMYNMIYTLLSGKEGDLDGSIEFLRDTPLDLVEWYIDHAKREDIHMVRKPVLEERQADKYLPPSIRQTVRWDKNPHSINGGSPAFEREPVFWLLPYWIGRYLKIITD